VSDTGAGSALRGLAVTEHNNGVHAPIIALYKSRGTEATPLTVVNGDYGGIFNYGFHDGTNYLTTASFGARANGTVATGSVPSELFFATSGGATDTDPYTNNHVRMLIASTGRVGIGTTAPLSKLDVLASGTALTNADVVGTAGNFEGPTPGGQSSTLSLLGNDAVAANIGGVLGFGGNYNGTQYANWASI